jgi:hypothetical protein
MRELKRYKEELVVIGLLSLLLLLVRWVSASIWPTTGQYDLAGETETVFWTVLRLVIYTLASWVGLRVVAPKAYNWLKHEIVDGFSSLTDEQKTSYSMRMYAILFFGLVLLTLSGCSAQELSPQRYCVVENAVADVGVREATGRNDGPEVEAYLKHVRLPKGNPWCAAFVCYQLSSCGVDNPRSGWSPAVAAAGRRVWSPRKALRSPLPGDVFSLFYPKLGREGHVGFVLSHDGKYITTVEGNTSGPGSREGDGVYVLKRQLNKCHAITSYFPDALRNTGADTRGSVLHDRLQNGTGIAAYGYGGEAGNAQRRVGARYPAHGAWSTRLGVDIVAALRRGIANAYSALGTGVEQRGDHRRYASVLRRVRYRTAGSEAVRPLEPGTQATRHGDHRGTHCHQDGGTQVGMVVARNFNSAAGETVLAAHLETVQTLLS